MSLLNFQRFPEIKLRAHTLIWDIRQKASSGPERVYIPNSLSDEIKIQLRQRALSSAGECVEGSEVLLTLGRDASEALKHPSRRLCVVGVTGTNGKTSTVEGLAWLYSSLGKKVLQIGTLGISLWEKALDGYGTRGETVESGFTTPEAPSLHALFEQALSLGVEFVVMEVSSHALELGRVSGIDFDAALFTNLSQDHLDFHGSMEAYGEAKRKLFRKYLKDSVKPHKFAVLAAPDSLSRDFVNKTQAALLDVSHEVIEFDKNLKIVQNNLQGLRFLWKGTEFSTCLLGEHNAWNLSLALALLQHQGFANSDLQSKLPFFPGPKGRMERVAGNCFVDYAHTPDALENVLKTILGFRASSQKVFCVMGCGGNRDRSKRPLMGAIAAKYADRVWITNDNPRFEDPSEIAKEILEGVAPSDRARVEVILDRAEAIAQAIERMNKDDILLVAGKGHETYQIFKDEKKYFSDRDEILRHWVASGAASR
jgi:UDP-N-acetylmuramyl-tripeptide synthetase